MRSIIRLAAAGAVALPLLIGTAGLASADVDYDHGVTFAGPDGSGLHYVASGANEHGQAYYYELFTHAGPEGSGVYEQGSFTDGESAHYFDDWSFAGPEGAVTGFTNANADHHDHHHHDDDHHDDNDDDYDD
jgi:hypothetical protein